MTEDYTKLQKENGDLKRQLASYEWNYQKAHQVINECGLDIEADGLYKRIEKILKMYDDQVNKQLTVPNTVKYTAQDDE